MIMECNLILENALNLGLVTIVDDRYGGADSDGKWLAWRGNAEDIPYESDSPDDHERFIFWKDYKGIVGKGNNPNDALIDLYKKVIEYQKSFK